MKPRREPSDPALAIRLLQVPDCPLVERLQAVLAEACDELGIQPEVTVDVGDYPSPTLLVAGRDVVTGQPVEGAARCRLDIPSRQSIVSALHQTRRGEPQAPQSGASATPGRLRGCAGTAG